MRIKKKKKKSENRKLRVGETAANRCTSANDSQGGNTKSTKFLSKAREGSRWLRRWLRALSSLFFFLYLHEGGRQRVALRGTRRHTSKKKSTKET